ncbi:hypothetical protein Fcan01_17292 [Folsomia candida]|uniref:Uncharacterized protein n=1 Tax=Folsomia candida TaxID=158441 RepID=A0A226DRY5_FOLCA|nr:hypothetical protein Fcan01_17292 [Folsomia candida]
MYHIHYIPSLKCELSLCKFLKCIPFEFDPKAGNVIKWVKHIQIVRLQCVLSVAYTAAQFANVFFGELSLTGSFQGAAFLPLYAMATVVRWNYSGDKEPIQVVNSFLSFEKKILRAKLVIMWSTILKLATNVSDLPDPSKSNMFCKLMRFFIPFAAGAFVVTIVLKFILLTFAPCTPPFLLSIVEDCGKTEVALLHLFESWMAWHMFTAGGWYTLYIIFAGIESILSYIFILEK